MLASPDVFTYTSKKTGSTYALNKRLFNGVTYYYFAGGCKDPVAELPERYMVIEARNGFPMVARKTLIP